MRARLTGVEQAIAALADALERTVPDGVERAAEAIAEQAREGHAFTNRTGDLEASIAALEDPHGSFLAGTLEGYVYASEDYASYVDEKPAYAFLEPAFAVAEGQAYAALESALDDAIERAGWSR